MGVTVSDAIRLGKVVGAGLQTPLLGDVACYQQAVLTQNSTTAVSATINVPVGAQIISFTVDVLTAFDSATSATLSVGTSAADTTYVSGVNAKTAGRTLPTYTAAQVTAFSPVTTSAVVATITPVGATTAGSVRVIVHYIPPTT